MNLTVPCFSAITDLGLILEYDNLITFKFPQGSGFYPGAFNSGIAGNYIPIVADKQHAVQLDGITLSYLQPLDLYLLFGGHLILFAPGFDNSVNLYPSKAKCKFTPLT